MEEVVVESTQEAPDENKEKNISEEEFGTDKVVEEERLTEEHIEGEHVENEDIENEHVESEAVDGEYIDVEEKDKLVEEGEEIVGEELEREGLEGEQTVTEEVKEEKLAEEIVEEEEKYIEEPPPDPAAPLDLSDFKEALKDPFELRPDQLAEVEQLWDLYQNYTPVYTDIDGYITEKELIYMLKALLLMTYTPEQLQELIAYCVRPAHPQGHISYEQFLKMVTIRQRDFPVEDELRSALQFLDPGKTGSMDREALKDLLANEGFRMSQKALDYLIKEVDLSNDGTIGVEDVVGTMCIDLNKEDIQMLLASLNPAQGPQEPREEEL